jgi:hypothetical protein
MENKNTNNVETSNSNTNEETLLLPQKEKEEKSCDSTACWWFQILIWIGALLLLYFDAYEISGSYIRYKSMTIQFMLTLIFEIILYIVYIIFEFLSPTFSYLLHKRTDDNLYDKLKHLFNTPPKIQFVCENYHYETRTYTTYDSKGNATTHTETVRVVTRVDSKYFNYYSSRDVSGLFRLNYDESSVRDKYYVKLQLLKSIDFADSISYNDYIKEKDEFYNSNKGFDVYTDLFVNETIDGFTDYNLINITQTNPCGISLFWYIFFLFSGIVQLYKVYINSRCIYKSFTIRKIISTRYSLTNEESDNKYRNVNPVISFEDENITFSSNEIGFISSDYIQNLPTLEEIESANQCNNKVFNPDTIQGNNSLIKSATPCDETQNSNNLFKNNNEIETELIS